MGESLDVDCNCSDFIEHVEDTEKGEIVQCQNCGNRYYNLDDDLVWLDDREAL